MVVYLLVVAFGITGWCRALMSSHLVSLVRARYMSLTWFHWFVQGTCHLTWFSWLAQGAMSFSIDELRKGAAAQEWYQLLDKKEGSVRNQVTV